MIACIDTEWTEGESDPDIIESGPWLSDDGLNEYRCLVAKSDEGYHWAVAYSFRGGDYGLDWSHPVDTKDEASHLAWFAFSERKMGRDPQNLPFEIAEWNDGKKVVVLNGLRIFTMDQDPTKAIEEIEQLLANGKTFQGSDADAALALIAELRNCLTI